MKRAEQLHRLKLAAWKRRYMSSGSEGTSPRKPKEISWESCGVTVNEELRRVLPDLCAGITCSGWNMYQDEIRMKAIQLDSRKKHGIWFRRLTRVTYKGHSLERLVGCKPDVVKKL